MSVSLNDLPNKVYSSGDTVTVTTGSGIEGPQGPTGATGAGGAVAYFGNFFSTETQANADVSAANTFTLNSTVDANGVSIVDGTKITFAAGSDGTYDLQFSAQFDKTDSGTDEVDIWISKNGTDLEWSNTVLSLVGNNAKAVPAWNWQLNDVQGGDYFEVHWWSPDSAMRVLAVAAGSNPTRPAVPSLIVTVAQVTYTQAGATGATGPQGPAGDPGPQGDQGIAVQGTAPANTTILWADTSEAGSMVVPAGGTTGQALTKNSNDDYDTEWTTITAGIPETLIDAKGDLIVGSAADTAARLAVGTNAHLLVADSSASGGLRWTRGNSTVGLTMQFYKSARYYNRLSATYGNRAIGADVVYFCPLILPFDATADRIAVSVVVAAGAGNNARLGIYNSSLTTSEPTTVIVSDVVAVDSTGAKTVTISQALSAGVLYWLAVQPQANITVNGWANMEIFGNSVVSPQGNNQADMFVSAAYASGLPANPSITNNVSASTVPVIQVRVT